MPPTRDAPDALSLKQWALGYLATAWVVIQVLQALSEAWELGSRVQQVVQLLLAVGFVVVLGGVSLRRRAGETVPARPSSGRPVLAVGGWVLALVLVVSLGYTVLSSQRTRHARNEVLPEAMRLAEAGQYDDAFELLQGVAREVEGDPLFEEAMAAAAVRRDVVSDPPGADVWSRPYLAADSAWQHLGVTPLLGIRVPRGLRAWRIVREGYVSQPLAPWFGSDLPRSLTPLDEVPEGMLPHPSGLYPAWTTDTGPDLTHNLPAFLYDRVEVTNSAFLGFVEAGAYQSPAFWEDLGVEPPSESQVASMVDRTGLPGPGGWEVGAPPPGSDDFPVSGVSWFEAMAYCRWQGKTLPTLYHWTGSSGVAFSSPEIAARANFASDGPRTADPSAFGRWGALELAGNLREWVWNESSGLRLSVGGSWRDPEYYFAHVADLDPMDRSPENGFRCILELEVNEDSRNARDPIALFRRDFTAETPVSDEVFEVFRRRFQYDRQPLDASVEASGTSPGGFVWERIAYTVPYRSTPGGAILLRPNGPGPHPVVIVFPGSGAFLAADFEGFVSNEDDWMLRSGRAVIYPYLRGTYVQGDSLESNQPSESKRFTEFATNWVQDVSRALDYLETRSDIATEAVAYAGTSWGGRMGPIVLAVEPRIRTGILYSGGMPFARSEPEVDPFNYASRVTQPVLMLNGMNDVPYPYETSQVPLYGLLGTPSEDKRHRTFPGVGHSLPRLPVIRESLTWLDRYQGPIQGR
ncbi:MAG: SUMF1/EgtB/PvdO family nonheme iron enzyme [Gemmatimonadales bacterium]|jgi:dienelactone hydrolase|nr:MAG: SUMF1/EgtB/PvdO family nonheme iron enzyme [Gemmatimonadales bacterium]